MMGVVQDDFIFVILIGVSNFFDYNVLFGIINDCIVEVWWYKKYVLYWCLIVVKF